MTMHSIILILAAILVLLFLEDFASTEYALHRWPAHAFENGRGMQVVIAWLHERLPTVKDTVVADLALLVMTLLPIALVYAMAAWLHPIVSGAAFVAGIVYQARTDYRNALVIRDLARGGP